MAGHGTARWESAALGLLALVCASAVIAGGGCEEPAERPVTLVLVKYEGPNATADAQRVAGELSQQGLEDVFIVEGADEATVCVGHFESYKDPQAKETRARVRQIRDARGQFPFAGVMLMPVPEPTPPSRWPIEKAPGLYSLYIASWESPGRKEAAESYAAELRGRGHEAYVHHGPRFSSVALGGFGLEIFDDPRKVGHPGMTPKIVSEEVLRLMREFPQMRLEGEVTPMVKASDGRTVPVVPTTLRRIPGREPPAVGAPMVPQALYKIGLQLVDTTTGVAAGLGRASGVAQSEREVPVLAQALTRQLVGALEKGKAARIGLVGVRATNLDASAARSDALVTESLAAALERVRAETPGLTVTGPAATRQILDASGMTPEDVLRDPRRARGLRDLDFVLTGTVDLTPL